VADGALSAVVEVPPSVMLAPSSASNWRRPSEVMPARTLMFAVLFTASITCW
jgi:hypothetical protein